MGHNRTPLNFQRLNKKKLVIIAVIVGGIILVVLILAITAVIAVINALAGQTDSGISQNTGNIVSSLYNYALDFTKAAWQQVIANPLQFITGGGG